MQTSTVVTMEDSTERTTGVNQPPRLPGFTLVEVLGAMVIAVLLISALVSLVTTQNRYGLSALDQVDAEQAVRAAVDLASSELRMAGAGDLIAAGPDLVSIRFDLSRAVVCEVMGPDEVVLFVYDSVTDANVEMVTAGTAWAGPGRQEFRYADGWMAAPADTGDDARELCAGSGATPAGGDDAYLVVDGWVGAFGGHVPGRGSLVRRYGQLTYRFGPSSFGSGWALWRGSQELVAPLSPGARFVYRMMDGSEVLDVSESSLRDVAEIGIVARAFGGRLTGANGGRAVAYGTPLRN